MNKGVFHRDLKPDNILLNSIKGGNQQEGEGSAEIEITIADFGFAMDASKERGDDTLICGTAGYFPPEILKGLPLSYKSDVFSLGCILYNLMSKRQLFFGHSQREILIKNKKCILPPTFDRDIRAYSR